MQLPQTNLDDKATFKGVLLCSFLILNFSLCVVCLGIKNIYKVTNLKVHQKREIFRKNKSLTARLDYSVVIRSFCDITKQSIRISLD